MITIGALLLAGAILHLLAWMELEDLNWFDIAMRQGPPFVDLSGTGQALIIASWLCGIAAVAMIIIVYIVPRVGNLPV